MLWAEICQIRPPNHPLSGSSLHRWQNRDYKMGFQIRRGALFSFFSGKLKECTEMIHRSREKIGPLFERLDNSWEHSALFPSTEKMKHAILDKNEDAGRPPDNSFLALLFECRFAMSGYKFGALTRFQGISHPHSTFFGTWMTLVTRIPNYVGYQASKEGWMSGSFFAQIL